MEFARSQNSIDGGESMAHDDLEAYVFPMSYAQKRLWFLDQLHPGNSAYNRPIAARVAGQLNIAALRQSLNAIVMRHESLRTAFGVKEGEPVQIISLTCRLPFQIASLEWSAPADQELLAMRLAREEAGRGFDLSCDSLARATLLRLSDKDQMLLLILHHAVSDPWSDVVLFEELAAFYGGFSSGRQLRLPEQAFQYADYAHWQQQWFDGGVLERQLSYWRKQLQGAPPPVELPTDRPRPAIPTFRGARKYFTLPNSLRAQIESLSRQEGVTSFMTLLAMFGALLHLYTAQTDICVGSPVTGRNRPEFEKIIGFFINTLALRLDLSGAPRFREYLRRVRRMVVGALAHADLPLERLVEELRPQRASGNAFFTVMFVLQNGPAPDFDLASGKLAVMNIDGGVSKFDLTWSLTATGAGYSGSVEYSADLFDETTIDRFLQHFEILMAGVVQDPDCRIDRLPLLTPVELAQLSTWNETGVERPNHRTLHEWFEAQAALTPEACAVACEDEWLTYEALNRKANQLAHFLKSLEIRVEDIVCVFLDRSTDMLLSLLATLKAGAAYLPLDPDHPRWRLQYIIEDARVLHLLTRAGLLDSLPAGDARVTLLDAEPGVDDCSEDNPRGAATPLNCCYAIYTSGSTGKPKGVQISHLAIINLLAHMQNELALKGSDIWLATTTLSFDIAALEEFLPILVGARVEIAKQETVADGAALIEALRSSEATVVQATPTGWRMILQAGLEVDGQVKILCGGEQLPLDLAEELAANGTTAWNLYGPTETTIWSSACRLRTGERRVSIGRPIANTQIYVLDANWRQAAARVEGELYISGVGLSRGYLNLPDMTAEKFLPNPFSRLPGERLYQTGDLARRFADLEIEILGRTDHQVKIRGFRIEFGEIETQLQSHPEVRQAVVVARPDGAGETALVAYITVTDGCAPRAAELRGFLKDRLPKHMIPSFFLTLVSLPLTPNGKIDRQALPAPDASQEKRAAESVTQNNPIEEIIAGIWAEILNLKRIGVDQDFFELGGHSLLATQALSRMRGTLSCQVTLRDFLNAPTASGLAKRIISSPAMNTSPALSRTAQNEAPAPSFAQRCLWFLDQLRPDSGSYNISAAVQLTGVLNPVALQTTIREVGRRHESLRSRFRSEAGRVSQIIDDDSSLPLLITDLRRIGATAAASRLSQLSAEESQRPFDLARDRLWRARLLQLSDRRYILLLTLHHIVSDGWSMGVLKREIMALYRAFSSGAQSPLVDLPMQYSDFARWQREWLESADLKAGTDYWERQLGGGAPALQMPTDFPRPAARAGKGARQPFSLSIRLSEELKILSRREASTLFMTMLAAFNVLLYRYTGQHEIVIGSPFANRNFSETEDLIGCFVNMLLLRANLTGNPSFRDLLRQVREMALGAYLHQGTPLELIVDQLQPERSLNRDQVFQVIFVFQNTPSPQPDLLKLDVEFLETDSGSAKVDLTLSVHETEQGVRGFFEYDTELFRPTTISRMVDNFQTLLESVIANPEESISTLPMLCLEERRLLAQIGEARPGDANDEAYEALESLDQLSNQELDELLRELS
jgi:amino acid adenylation domain-containing protein